jgi:hypothetical protein
MMFILFESSFSMKQLLKVLGIWNLDQNKVYKNQVVTAVETVCAVNEISAEYFQFGLFQRKVKNEVRFISINGQATKGIVVSGTPFKIQRDNYFADQFVLPSDSVPDMFRGGIRNTYTGSRKSDHSLEEHTIPWTNQNCSKYYSYIAVFDRLMDELNGAQVKHGNILWTVNKDFYATSTGDNKGSHLRLLFYHDKSQITLMGFNRQSLTLDLTKSSIKKSYQVDPISLWIEPMKPQERDSLEYHSFDQQWFQSDILHSHTISALVQIWYKYTFPLGKDFGMQKFYILKEYSNEVSFTGTNSTTI